MCDKISSRPSIEDKYEPQEIVQQASNSFEKFRNQAQMKNQTSNWMRKNFHL